MFNLKYKKKYYKKVLRDLLNTPRTPEKKQKLFKLNDNIIHIVKIISDLENKNQSNLIEEIITNYVLNKYLKRRNKWQINF